MRKKYLLLLMVLLLTAIPCFSQGMGTNAGCNIAGTWYGGSLDAPFPYYRLNIVPISADHMSITAQLMFEFQSQGFLNLTDWTGDLYKSGAHSWKGMIFQMLQLNRDVFTPANGYDADLPEIDFIRISNVEFSDCNTVKFSYDLWAVYYNYTYASVPKPLETPPAPPGFVFNPLLEEVYSRIPSSVSPDFVAVPNSAAKKPPRRK